MTTWNPGDGGPDVLSTGDEGPPWADRLRTTAVAVVCLVAGAFLGTRLDDASAPFSSPPGSPPTLTGGVVTPLAGIGDPLPHQFRVSLFNPGERTLRVLVVGFTGWSTTAANAGGVDVAAHSWGHATFSLPEVCEEPTPAPTTALQIRIVDPEAVGEQRVELAEPADAVRADRDLECRAPTVLRTGQLTGLWHLEEVRSGGENLAGKALVRFTSDGRFALDPGGRMFDEGHQDFFGTYRLHGSRLHMRAEGGYACEAGFTAVWLTTLLEAGHLRLDIVRADGGYCNSPLGGRHTLRRLLPERGLPPGPATGSR